MKKFNFKMDKLFLSLIMLLACFQLTAQVNWTGAAGTSDWNDGGNWDKVSGLPPSSGDVVLIPSGNTVDFTGTSTVQRVKLSGSAKLNVLSGTLTIDGATAEEALEQTGSSSTIVNDGTIIIQNTTLEGVQCKGTWTNNGTLTINDTGRHNLRVQGGSFTNSANSIINITLNTANTDMDGLAVDDNGGSAGTFTNNGTVNITMTAGDEGIDITDGSTLTNNNIIDISGGGADMGIKARNNGVLTNNANATLTITNTPDVGLQVTDDAVFTNMANAMVNISGASNYSIQIDANSSTMGPAEIINNGTITLTGGSNDGVRIQEAGLFTNNATLTINSPGDEGIQIDDATNVSTFDNFGIINITSSSGHAMEVWGTFNNENGSTFQAEMSGDDGIRMRNNTGATPIVNNDGAIRIDNSNDDDIETDGFTFSNTANATFAPGSSPGDLKIEDNFDLGFSSTTFEINGLTAITQYDQILNKNNANSITISNATANLVWGFTPDVDDCFKIIDESGSVVGEFATVTSTSSTSSIDYTIDYDANTDEVIICVDAVGPLPVELINFTAEKTNQGSELKWATASEENNDGFEVEHSTNGRDFYMLDKVDGNGTSSFENNYEYLHKNPANGDNYYRLKQVDFNGNFEYSNIVNLRNKTDDIPTSIYPNPAYDVITYEGAAATLTVYDIYGRLVLQQTTEEEKTNLDISILETGAYMIEISNGTNETVFKRFIKSK